MKILALPRDANPYQELLYAAVRRQGVAVDYLEGPSGSQTLNILLLPLLIAKKRLQGYNVLHVHWTFGFRLPFGGVLGRAFMELWAAGVWCLAKLYGMRLVWTAHNAAPHEPIFLNDRRAHRFLGRQAAAVIAHTTAARQQLLALGVPQSHIHIIPHGNYIGTYPDTVTASEARRRLQIPARATVLLFFGLIRPYKGIEQLLAAFRQLPREAATVLVIAGAVQDQRLNDELEQAAANDDRIRLHLRHIPEDEAQLFFRSADFTVLPYEKATTSGVALLACSFGCPLITPHQAVFADLPANAGLQYDAGGLPLALQQASETSGAQRRQFAAAAYAYAKDLSWDTIAAQTIKAIQQRDAA